MQNHSSLEKRLLLTVAGLAVYRLLWLVPLPNLSASAISTIRTDAFAGLMTGSIAALGLAPIVAGFLLVELYSLVIPWGRRVRQRGEEGRRTLTRWSLQVSLFFAVIQAMGIVSTLGTLFTVEDLPVLADPGLLPRMAAVVTLVATSFAVYSLGRWMTRKGFGNGFCLLILINPLVEVLGDTFGSTRTTYSSIPWDFVHGLAALLTVTFLVHHFRGSLALPGVEGEVEKDERTRSWTLPTFPQGLVPAMWALGLVQFFQIGWGFWWWNPERVPLLSPGSVIPLMLLTFLIPFLSWGTLNLFSTRGRLVTNLPEVTIPKDFDAALDRRFLASTVLLMALVVGFGALGSFTYWSAVLDVVLLVGLAALGTDLFEEWQFRRRQEDVAELVELDNVQLALYLRSNFQRLGIDTQIQALHYRSLTYFLAPLYKMTVLVPADQLEEARKRWAELAPRIV